MYVNVYMLLICCCGCMKIYQEIYMYWKTESRFFSETGSSCYLSKLSYSSRFGIYYEVYFILKTSVSSGAKRRFWNQATQRVCQIISRVVDMYKYFSKYVQYLSPPCLSLSSFETYIFLYHKINNRMLCLNYTWIKKPVFSRSR